MRHWFLGNILAQQTAIIGRTGLNKSCYLFIMYLEMIWFLHSPFIVSGLLINTLGELHLPFTTP